VRDTVVGAPLFACAVAWLGFAATARADAIDPDPPKDACASKADGDACDVDGKAGACKKTKCERRIGGVLNPSVIQEDCLVCDPALQPKTAEPTATPAKADSPTKASPPTKTAAVEDATKSSVCSVSAERTPLASFGLGIVLLLVARKTARQG
jgi:hypothetical protein